MNRTRASPSGGHAGEGVTLSGVTCDMHVSFLLCDYEHKSIRSRP
jgi:hypothetical protein